VKGHRARRFEIGEVTAREVDDLVLGPDLPRLRLDGRMHVLPPGFVGRDPGLRISPLRERLGPYRPKDLAKYEEGLRKAGVSE
jgi:hypothetical protein